MNITIFVSRVAIKYIIISIIIVSHNSNTIIIGIRYIHKLIQMLVKRGFGEYEAKRIVLMFKITFVINK